MLVIALTPVKIFPVYLLNIFVQLGKAVAPSLVLVIIGSSCTPRPLIKFQAVMNNPVLVEKRETARPSLAISTVGAQATTSRALGIHIFRTDDTFPFQCPFPAAAVEVHTICDVVIRLAVSPFVILVVVAGGCTP